MLYPGDCVDFIVNDGLPAALWERLWKTNDVYSLTESLGSIRYKLGVLGLRGIHGSLGVPTPHDSVQRILDKLNNDVQPEISDSLIAYIVDCLKPNDNNEPICSSTAAESFLRDHLGKRLTYIFHNDHTTGKPNY